MKVPVKYRTLTALSITLILSVLSSCATVPSRCNVAINSFAGPEAEKKRNFIILPGLDGVSANDLEFQEYASLASRVMEGQGFTKAPTGQEANLVVFLAYSIGEPETRKYTYAVPHFGQTGVSSSTTYGSVNSTGYGSANYSATTYNTPSYGITGYSSQVGSVTTFTRVLSLEGVDLDFYRQSAQVRQLWKTKVASVGSSGDLRSLVPVLLVAASQYIGGSTGQIINIEISLSDPRINTLRGGVEASVK